MTEPTEEQSTPDPLWDAQRAAEKALSLAMVRLGGEPPSTVYDEKGYVIWVEGVSKAVTQPMFDLFVSERAARRRAEEDKDEWKGSCESWRMVAEERQERAARAEEERDLFRAEWEQVSETAKVLKERAECETLRCDEILAHHDAWQQRASDAEKRVRILNVELPKWEANASELSARLATSETRAAELEAVVEAAQRMKDNWAADEFSYLPRQVVVESRLDLFAALAALSRGKCPECGQVWALKIDGSLRFHRWCGSPCRGSGQRPV